MTILEENIKKSATEVYFGYLALAFSTSDRSKQQGLLNNIANQVTFEGIIFPSLLETIGYISSNNRHNQNNIITVGSQKLLLDIERDENESYKVCLNRVDDNSNKLEKSQIPEVKTSVLEYSLNNNPYDLAKIYENTNFRYFPKQDKLGVDISTKIDGQEMMTIGVDKKKLWENQIDSLAQIILSDKEDKLIDQATGSGKSFLQAGMYIVLARAEAQTIFSVPDDALKSQLYDDFKLVIPHQLIEKLSAVSIKDNPENNFILTHDELLNYQWNDLVKHKNFRNIVMSVDEAHQPMSTELTAGRLKRIKDETVLFAFTASPNQKTLELLGEAVSHFSKNDKISYGLVQQVEVVTINARSFAHDQNDKSVLTNFKTAVFGESKVNSPAHTYFNELETSVIIDKKWIESHQTSREKLRWGATFPIGEKALVLTDSIDIIHNAGKILKYATSPVKKDSSFHEVNMKARARITENKQSVAGTTDAIGKAARALEIKIIKAQRANYIENIIEKTGISENELKELVDFRGVEDYVHHRVLHGLIENYVKAATGLNTVQLDVIRKDPVSLKKLSKMIPVSNENIAKHLQGLRSSGLPEKEITELKSVMDEFRKLTLSDEQKIRFVDNWSVDKALHNDIKSFSELYNKISIYTREHAYAISVNAESHQEHSIADNVIKGWHNFDRGREEENEYWGYSIREVDAIFKAGLLGMYVSSEKTTGFSDPDLQSLGVLLDNKLSKINEPDTMVQAFGRARGLNFNRKPLFLGVSKQGVKISVDIKGLERGNKFDLIKLMNDYQKSKEKDDIPLQILNDLKKVIKLHMGRGDLRLLELDCQKVLNMHLNDVFNKYHFNMQKSQEVFAEILDKATREAQKELYNGYDIGNIVYSVAERVENLGSYVRNSISYFYSQKSQLNENIHSLEEKAYANIINNYDIGKVTKHSSIAVNALQKIFNKRENSIQIISNQLLGMLSDDMNEALKTTMTDAILASVNNFDKKLAEQYITEYYNEITSAMAYQLYNSDLNQILELKFNLAKFLQNSKSFPEFMKKNKLPLVYNRSKKSNIGVVELGINAAKIKIIDLMAEIAKGNIVLDKEQLTTNALSLINSETKQLFKEAIIKTILDSSNAKEYKDIQRYLDLNSDKILKEFVIGLLEQGPMKIMDYQLDISNAINQVTNISNVTNTYKINMREFIKSFTHIEFNKYISGVESLSDNPFSITNQIKAIKDKTKIVVLNLIGEQVLPILETKHTQEAIRYLFDSNKISEDSFITIAKKLDGDDVIKLNDVENKKKLIVLRDNLLKLTYAKSPLQFARVMTDILDIYEGKFEELVEAAKVLGNFPIEIFKDHVHYHEIDIGRLGLNKENAAVITQNPKPALIDNLSPCWNLHDPYTMNSLPMVRGITADRQTLYMAEIAPITYLLNKFDPNAKQQKLSYKNAVDMLDIDRFRSFENLPPDYNPDIVYSSKIAETNDMLSTRIKTLGQDTFKNNLRNLDVSLENERYEPFSTKQIHNENNSFGCNNAAISQICQIVLFSMILLVAKIARTTSKYKSKNEKNTKKYTSPEILSSITPAQKKEFSKMQVTLNEDVKQTSLNSNKLKKRSNSL